MKRRHEYFRIRKFARRYDKQTGKFTFNIAYETAAELTPRTLDVAEAFGLGIDETQKFVVYDNVELQIGPKDIVYITGDSGSGKSVLLKAIKHDLGDEAIDMTDIHVDADKANVETVGKNLTEALELLSKAGLNDAFLFVRSFRELSDGQKYRYKLAKLMESDKQWWICDEFCSVLDRDTAKIVAFNLQKIARQLNNSVIVATTHDDLFEDLHPSVRVHKKFGKEITVDYYANEPAKQCSLVKEMHVEEGCYQDYKRLSSFHYRSGRCSPPRKIFTLKRSNELCGVIVYSYPPPMVFGRSKAWKGDFSKLQREVSTISRVIVHPKYRSVGLGAKLVGETLGLAGTPCVEMVAVMAKHNPFAEKAGMKRIVEQSAPKEALKIVEVLERLGFNRRLLGCEKLSVNKLTGLSEKDVNKVREAFVENSHPRFMKYFAGHEVFVNKHVYTELIRKASLEKLAHLTKVCGFLLQTKVYLFWKQPRKTKKGGMH